MFLQPCCIRGLMCTGGGCLIPIFLLQKVLDLYCSKGDRGIRVFSVLSNLCLCHWCKGTCKTVFSLALPLSARVGTRCGLSSALAVTQGMVHVKALLLQDESRNQAVTWTGWSCFAPKSPFGQSFCPLVLEEAL